MDSTPWRKYGYEPASVPAALAIVHDYMLDAKSGDTTVAEAAKTPDARR